MRANSRTSWVVMSTFAGLTLLMGMGQGCPSPADPTLTAGMGPVPPLQAPVSPVADATAPPAVPWSPPAAPPAPLAPTAPPATSASAASSASSSPPSAPACLTGPEEAKLVEPAAYAVVIEFLGEDTTVPVFVGSAFAIHIDGYDNYHLATNAHVALAVSQPQPLPTRIVAVQSGTGAVVELTRAIIHRDYSANPNPFKAPDVAILTTKTPLPQVMPLAPPDAADLAVNQNITVYGFPGDVADQVKPIIPGQTRARASALQGSISNLYSFKDNVTVTTANVDIIQHQAPTTPGTSGSPIVRCGQVIGANNAGTINLIVTPQADGSFAVDRQPVAANNYGIHVRHLWDLISQFRNQTVQGLELPPPVSSGNAGGAGSAQVSPFAGTYVGSADSPRTHSFTFSVAEDGTITGTAAWFSQTLNLSGQVTATGELQMEDDGEAIGWEKGVYTGTIHPQTRQASGQYLEEGTALAVWQARFDGSGTGGTGGTSSASPYAGTYQGAAADPQVYHTLAFRVNPDGTVVGTSFWSDGTLNLVGTVDASGRIDFGDTDGIDTYYRGTFDPQTGWASGGFYYQGQRLSDWVAQPN